jgi:Dna[CI] antecedent, DciA
MQSFTRQAPVTLLQAAQASPTLSQLARQAQDSQDRLSRVRASLPMALRAQVKAGPLREGQWCLLVPTPAAAAKLRQCVPALLAQLGSQGQGVESIRIKVSAG